MGWEGLWRCAAGVLGRSAHACSCASAAECHFGAATRARWSVYDSGQPQGSRMTIEEVISRVEAPWGGTCVFGGVHRGQVLQIAHLLEPLPPRARVDSLSMVARYTRCGRGSCAR